MFDRDQKRLSLRNVASILEVQRNAGVPAPPPLRPPSPHPRQHRLIECFHMTSRRPYWWPKTMKRRPCWRRKPYDLVGVELLS